MQLRWLTTYDTNGKDSSKVLQVWDTVYEYWADVPDVRCSEDDSDTIYAEPEEKNNV